MTLYVDAPLALYFGQLNEVADRLFPMNTVVAHKFENNYLHTFARLSVQI